MESNDDKKYDQIDYYWHVYLDQRLEEFVIEKTLEEGPTYVDEHREEIAKEFEEFLKENIEEETDKFMDILTKALRKSTEDTVDKEDEDEQG